MNLQKRTRGDAEEQKGNKSEEDPKKDAESEAKDKTKETEERLLAFKALPPQLTAAKYESDKVASTSEVELIRHICDVIHKARVQATGGRDCKAVPDEGESAFEVKEEDVISVAKARKNTGYVESIGYSLKRLVLVVRESTHQLGALCRKNIRQIFAYTYRLQSMAQIISRT